MKNTPPENKGKGNYLSFLKVLPIVLITILTIAIITIIYYLGRETFNYIDGEITSLIKSIPAPFFIIPFIFIVIAIFTVAFNFISESKVNSEKQNSDRDENKNSNKESSKEIASNLNREKIFLEVSEEIKKGASESFINDVKQSIITENKRNVVQLAFEGAIENLHNNSAKTRLYTQLNLAFGITISGCAIAMLGFSVFELSTSVSGGFWLIFTSRLTVSISIQLLAMFFLKLYKNNLIELKYIQNEITNIESRKIASIIARDFSEKNKMKIIDALIETERNFILDKGKTTITLEQIKIQNKDSNSYLKIIEELISIKNLTSQKSDASTEKKD